MNKIKKLLPLLFIVIMVIAILPQAFATDVSNTNASTSIVTTINTNTVTNLTDNAMVNSQNDYKNTTNSVINTETSQMADYNSQKLLTSSQTTSKEINTNTEILSMNKNYDYEIDITPTTITIEPSASYIVTGQAYANGDMGDYLTELTGQEVYAHINDQKIDTGTTLDANGQFSYDLIGLKDYFETGKTYNVTFDSNVNTYYDYTYLPGSIMVTVSAPEGTYVSTTGNDDTGDGTYSNPYKTITKAVTDAKENAKIYILPGTYTESSIPITTTLNISNFGGNVVIDANKINNIFKVSNDATLTINGLTLINAINDKGNQVDYGGAIYAETGCSLIILNSNFINNTVEDAGAAIYSEGKSIYIENSTFINNRGDAIDSGNGGAVATTYGTSVTAINSLFENNVIDNTMSFAGALYSMGYANILNCAFINNSALSYGAVYTYNNCSIINSTFINNSAANNGGAIGVSGLNGNYIINSSFINNTAGANGGAIYAGLGQATLLGNLNITSSSFKNNSAKNGGAIYACKGTTDLTDNSFSVNYSVFNNNTATNANDIYYTNVNSNLNYNWYGNNNPFNGTSYNKHIYNGKEYIAPSNWVIMNLTSDKSLVYPGQTITLTATLNQYYDNTSKTVKKLDKNLATTTITFSTDLGVLNPTSSNITNNINSVFSSSNPGFSTLTATIDNQSLTNNVTILLIPTDLYVNNSYTGNTIVGNLKYPFKNITDAVKLANTYSNCIIHIIGGTYNDVNMTVSSTTTLTNYNNDKVIIDAAKNGYIFVATGSDTTLTVKGLTFINAVDNEDSYPYAGSVLYTEESNLQVINCNFINNTAIGGAAAIYSKGNSLNIINSTFANNAAKGTNIGGGAIYCENNLNVTDSTFENNSIGGYTGAGAIYSKYYTNITRCTFINNSANLTSAGAISNGWGCIILNSTFINNTAAISAGAVSLTGEKDNNITNSIFINNTAKKGNGGAVYTSESVNVVYSTFINNTAFSNGGAISSSIGSKYCKEGKVNITSSTFTDNQADNGGAVSTSYVENVLINYSVFINNKARTNASDIYYTDTTSLDANYNWYGNNTPFNGVDYNKHIFNGTNFTSPSNWVIMNLTSMDNGDTVTLNVFLNQYYDNVTGTVKTLSNPLPARILMFNSESGNFYPTISDITNKVTSTYVASDIPGTYTLSATIDGQTLSVNTTVPLRETSIVEENITVNVNGTVTIHVISSKGIVNVGTVNLIYNNKAIGSSVVKDGVATFDLTGLNPGNYNVTAFYFGKNPYDSSSKVINLTITNDTAPVVDNSTVLTGNNLTETYGQGLNYTGKLLDAQGKGIAGKHVAINLTRLSNGLSKVYWVTTDTNGEYQLVINLAPGNYSAKTTYDNQSVVNSIVVNSVVSNNTVLSANKFNQTFNAGQNFTGKLVDNVGSPIIGQHIEVNLTRLSNGLSKVYWVTTDTNGEYQLAINLGVGEYTAFCTYSGTSYYSGSSANTTLTVLRV
ncbi:MAG: Ig-like domain repeat protein [Methanobacteriaceae archaeon]|nr:Ig-like domain repeat protein [Methanobacteriaceae archaeon]